MTRISKPDSDDWGPINPGPQDVLVFSAPVSQEPGCVESLYPLLSAEEKARAARFSRPEDRDVFIAGRALLRWQLRRAGIEMPTYDIGPFGKPTLAGDAGDPPLKFNLAHTTGLAICALTRAGEIGIDAEALNARLATPEAAREFLAPPEQEQLERFQGEARMSTFFRFWTLKEAVVKAVGQGLSLPLQDFVFTLDPLTFAVPASRRRPGGHWHVQERRVTSRIHAALAVDCLSSRPLTVTWRDVTVRAIAKGLQGR